MHGGNLKWKYITFEIRDIRSNMTILMKEILQNDFQ
jgi:hypothetical protein